MKLGLVVNNIDTEAPDYTTTQIALTATNMGHQVWYIGLKHLAYGIDDSVYAVARRVPLHRYLSQAVFIRTLQSKKATEKQLNISDLDILWLRNDPAEDTISRPWAKFAGIDFGRLAMRKGVLVVNDPDGLSVASNKMYLQYFPEEVRPRTIVSQDPADIKHFIHEEGGLAVLKPLSGSGGHNVFLIHNDDKPNINQIIEAISSEGYVVAQEYLPEAVNGDTRMFLLNGKPLVNKNKFAIMQRYRESGDTDMRSNMSAGAVAKKANLTVEMLEIAEIVRPKLVQDGMFFVGLDIVGNKLMEINVFSPGGLHECDLFEKSKFCPEIIHALERKLGYIKYYKRDFENVEMAIL